ncbi:uracil-DNA glycosylase [Aestuariibius sp. 2305UL40-4]|uniref:uracil-DNA glycosylase n=1 Tax=Aestuariibius violaceus TaxID=3234132 RepID=UPI00345ED88A
MPGADRFWSDFAALDWQVELGADESIGDIPVNRYDLPAEKTREIKTAKTAAPVPAPSLLADVDPVVVARAAAQAASDLDGLAAAMAAYEHCELKKGARNFVFCDGNPNARVMIVGEAPGRDEDLQGRPFVGRAGQLLDRMLAAIDMARDHPDTEHAVYITNVLPWRPPQNRTPDKAEIAMLLPFLERHVALADPYVLVLMGNTPCQAVLGRTGITRLRGNWTEAMSKPLLPMFHPAYLLRQPAAKREAWADLLSLKAKLREL